MTLQQKTAKAYHSTATSHRVKIFLGTKLQMTTCNEKKLKNQGKLLNEKQKVPEEAVDLWHSNTPVLPSLVLSKSSSS